MAAPGRAVCPICGYDDDVKRLKVDDVWIMTCENRAHLPFEWTPKVTAPGPQSYRSGLGEEWGVYDDLLYCVDDVLTEYGVIEYRFWKRAPKTYDFLVRRYGHRAVAPSKYTASSFLGGALGQLWREELVTGRWGPATGYWSYNSEIGTYAQSGAAEDGEILSWVAFADANGIPPADWPPLGFKKK
jgi:hypothetical protein